MESRTLLHHHETEAFMRGELDNVTVAHGALCWTLSPAGMCPMGATPAPPYPAPTFDALRVSWNAGTPPGTAVEAQARVMVDGNWTSWSSFGRLGPYLEREEGATRDQRRCKTSLPDGLVLDSKTTTPGPGAHLPVYQRRTHHPFRQPGWGSACER